MSKSKITIALLFTLAVIAAIIGGLFLQQHKVDITTNTPVELFSGDNKVATIDTQQELSLNDGEYCAVAVNDTYSKDKDCFMVFKKDKEVTLDIAFSKDELASKLEGEYAAIKEVITAKYATIINQYTICKGELLGDATWYGGILRDKVASLSDGGNYYYYIMKKDANWNLKTTPNVAISLYEPESKDIPEKVVKYVNTMQACESEVTDPANVPLNPIDSFTADKPVLVY